MLKNMYQDNSEFHLFPRDFVAEEHCTLHQGTQSRGHCHPMGPPATHYLQTQLDSKCVLGLSKQPCPTAEAASVNRSILGICHWGTHRQPLKAMPPFALVFTKGVGRGPFHSDEGWRSGEGILKNCSVLT